MTDERPFRVLKPYERMAQDIDEYTVDIAGDAADGCRDLGWVALGGRSTTHLEEIAEKLEAVAENAESLAERVRGLDDPRTVREEKYDGEA